MVLFARCLCDLNTGLPTPPSPSTSPSDKLQVFNQLYFRAVVLLHWIWAAGMLLAAVREALRVHAAQEHWSFYNSSSWYLKNTQENCDPTVRRIDEAWIYWKSWKSSGYKDERAFMTGWQEQSLCNLSWPRRWPRIEQQIEQGDFLRFSLVPHAATGLSAILWHWETALGTRVFQLMGYTSLFGLSTYSALPLRCCAPSTDLFERNPWKDKTGVCKA